MCDYAPLLCTGCYIFFLFSNSGKRLCRNVCLCAAPVRLLLYTFSRQLCAPKWSSSPPRGACALPGKPFDCGIWFVCWVHIRISLYVECVLSIKKPWKERPEVDIRMCSLHVEYVVSPEQPFDWEACSKKNIPVPGERWRGRCSLPARWGIPACGKWTLECVLSPCRMCSL